MVVIYFRSGSFGIGDLNQRAKPFHFFRSRPFDRSPLGRPWTAGASWRVWLVTGSWSYLNRSKLLVFNWVGGWDVLVVHQLPTSKLLGVSCKPQSISSSEGCSCNRDQYLSGFFVCKAEELEAGMEGVIRESFWSDHYRAIFQLSSCILSFLNQFSILKFVCLFVCFCFVLFCFVLFCFVLFCFVLFLFFFFFFFCWSWPVQGSPEQVPWLQ